MKLKVKGVAHEVVIMDPETGWCGLYTSLTPLKLWDTVEGVHGEKYKVVRLEGMTTYYE